MSTAQIVSDPNSGVLSTNNAQLVSIGHPEERTQPPLEQPQPPPQQPPVLQPPVLQPPAPQSPPDPAFVAQFEQVTGMKPEQFGQAVQQFQQMQQLVAQQAAQQQLATLKQEWGDGFDSMMPEVAKRFAALPPQMQASLDNLDGARLLYSQIMQEKAAQGPQVPYAQPPRYDRPSVPQNLQKAQEPQFTKEEIRSMSESDYIKNQAAISYAYQNGLVR